MPDTAFRLTAPFSSRAIPVRSYAITDEGPFTIACSTRSRSSVDVISPLVLTRASRISTLRSAMSRLALCRAPTAVSVSVVRANSSSSSNGVPSRRFAASTTPTSAPLSMRGATIKEKIAPTSIPALRATRRSLFGDSISTGSPSSDTSPAMPSPGFCVMPSETVGSTPDCCISSSDSSPCNSQRFTAWHSSTSRNLDAIIGSS